MTLQRTNRRVVLAAGAALTGTALTGCGDNDDTGGGSSTDESAGPSGDGESREAGESEGGSGDALAQTSDIPVGGGKVFGDEKVVVTQPAEGDFKAFSAVCTHQGCVVKSVESGTINCACHGSKFSIEDASVKAGPATRPLPGAKITVSGGSISVD